MVVAGESYFSVYLWVIFKLYIYFNLKGAFSVKYNVNSENCKEL